MRTLYLFHDQNRTFVPVTDGLTIGRTAGDVQFASDPLISRLHCRFHIVGSDVFVEDLDTTNRTHVNRVPVMPKRKRRVLLNDVIKVGDQRFILTQQHAHVPAGSQDQTMYRKIVLDESEEGTNSKSLSTLVLGNEDLCSEMYTGKYRRMKKLERRRIKQKKSEPKARWVARLSAAAVVLAAAGWFAMRYI